MTTENTRQSGVAGHGDTREARGRQGGDAQRTEEKRSRSVREAEDEIDWHTGQCRSLIHSLLSIMFDGMCLLVSLYCLLCRSALRVDLRSSLHRHDRRPHTLHRHHDAHAALTIDTPTPPSSADDEGILYVYTLDRSESGR